MKIALMLLTLAISTAGQAQPVRFAVAPGIFTGDARTKEWLPAGVTFDLEKRLERWPGLQNSDRLRVRGALKTAAATDDHSAAKALFEQLDLDVAITVTGKRLGDRLELQACLWTTSSTSAHTVTAQGPVSDLFALHDKLIDGLESALRAAFPKLQAPEIRDRLRIAPAKSVEAYEYLVRGMVALQNGSPEAARPLLEKACAIDSKLWWSRYFLGAVEFHEGRFEKAIENCRAAIAIDPDLYAGVYANLAYCYQGTADKERYEWAKSEFERRTGKSLPVRALPVRGVTQNAPS